jgi:hypothetical protein
MASLLWAFSIVLHAFDFGKKYLKWYAVFAGLKILVFIWKSISASTYESYKMYAIIETYRVMPFGRAYITEAIGFIVQYYQELLLLLTCTLAGLVVQRDFKRLVFVCVCVVGMLIVIHGAHYGFQHSRYQEQVYFPLAWIVAFPAVMCFIRKPWIKKVRVGFISLCVLLFTIKIAAIYREAPAFAQRTTMMEREIDLAREVGIQKGIIGEANVTRRSSVDPNWSYAIETMLLSARQRDKPVVSICLDSDMAFEGNAGKVKDSDFLMRRWDVKPLTWLNEDYFKLPIGPYHSFTRTDHNPVVSDEMVSNVEIQMEGDEFHMPRGQYSLAMVRLVNHGDSAIPADTSFRINLSYHWFSGEDVIQWDGERTPIEVDLLPGTEYVQTIDVLAPEYTGHYILVVDLVAEGRRWFGIDKRQEFWIY